MTTQKATAILEEEHRFIQKVAAAMAVLADHLELEQEVDAETLRDMVEFMRTFADRCHHGKEETYLFTALEKKGVPMHGCPMGALLGEHQRGRVIVAQLAETIESYTAGHPEARAPLIESLRGLTGLYPNHIWKEDYLLFPMADKILSPEEQQELLARFEAVEEPIGEDLHHRFERLANWLEEETRPR
jgi:hemerythrin-like domain-containing protein